MKKHSPTRWTLACLAMLLSRGAVADSEIYCEVSSINFAWGVQYGGTVIDSSGAVALFDYDAGRNPRHEARLLAENRRVATREDLAERFSPGRRVVGSICAARRTWLRDQLEVVRTAGQSRAVATQVFDVATAATHCYVFATNQELGTWVLLHESGTAETHSLSPSAPHVANWLNAVAAEARRRADSPAKQHSCIDAPPPLAAPAYPDTEARKRAMNELKALKRLHCQFSNGTNAAVDGEHDGNHPVPGALSMVFTNLDVNSRSGHAEMFGDAYAVRVDISAVGLLLTNLDAERRNLSDVVTIVPYRIRERDVYPAVKQAILAHNYGAIATRYTGQCTPLP